MRLIGKRIRELRERCGLSQGDIEQRTGMLRGYISKVEHGRTVPSLENLERFASAFGVPLHEMFRETPQSVETTGARSSEDPFLSVLSGYLRRMDRADRDILMALAEHLAQKLTNSGAPFDSKGTSQPSAQEGSTPGGSFTETR
jgi:transcriptional regulator with XRE-family HTH domain